MSSVLSSTSSVDHGDNVTIGGVSLSVDALKVLAGLSLQPAQNGNVSGGSTSSNLSPNTSTHPSTAVKPEEPPLREIKMHERLYMSQGFLQVIIEDRTAAEDKAYKFPSFFVQDSPWFTKRFLPVPHGTQTVVFDTEADDIKTGEFEAFLCVLFPKDFAHGDLSTQSQWIAVLKLATRWSFQSIRDLAITKLDSIVSPIDRLELARTYEIRAWVDIALEDLCKRQQSPSLPDIRRMAHTDIALVWFMHVSRPPTQLRTAIGAWRRNALRNAGQADAALLNADLAYASAQPRAPEAQPGLHRTWLSPSDYWDGWA
ncbi:hypothetical protein K488DRAFT_87895 [Vararia minispora EC-137]|uniref:Uncharacterized protein n=1 Tax=Vararia minispora EC-137 TaxID=1314806 RepID=A0ACB8QFH2_9AGAM|nr:hypothetical protein K488DRAFT_87895 [Vararia minispora EC-137]